MESPKERLVMCTTCDDIGWEELGGYIIRCTKGCNAAYRYETELMKDSLKHHEQQARKLRKQLKQRLDT